VSITRCSECRDPAHASETDDADRCGKCRLRAIIGGRVPLISFDVDDGDGARPKHGTIVDCRPDLDTPDSALCWYLIDCDGTEHRVRDVLNAIGTGTAAAYGDGLLSGQIPASPPVDDPTLLEYPLYDQAVIVSKYEGLQRTNDARAARSGPPFKPTQAERDAWSVALRAKVQASDEARKERDRNQVICQSQYDLEDIDE